MKKSQERILIYTSFLEENTYTFTMILEFVIYTRKIMNDMKNKRKYTYVAKPNLF